ILRPGNCTITGMPAVGSGRHRSVAKSNPARSVACLPIRSCSLSTPAPDIRSASPEPAFAPRSVVSSRDWPSSICGRNRVSNSCANACMWWRRNRSASSPARVGRPPEATNLNSSCWCCRCASAPAPTRASSARSPRPSSLIGWARAPSAPCRWVQSAICAKSAPRDPPCARSPRRREVASATALSSTTAAKPQTERLRAWTKPIVNAACLAGPAGKSATRTMSLPLKKALILPLSEERRRFQRVRVNLLGRYMLADRREFPCQVTDVSPGGMALVAPVVGQIQERVIAYVDHVGRLEGLITRPFQNGFAMTIGATTRKRDKLVAQLTWLANRHLLSSPEDRRHGRMAPRNPLARLVLPNGVNLAVRVIDISQSGCAMATEHRPEIGAGVTVGKTAGRVVRHLEDGFAVEFVRLQHPDFVEENVTDG